MWRSIDFWDNNNILLTDAPFQIQMIFSHRAALLTLIIPLITQVFFFIHIVRSAILAVRRRPLTPAFWITTSIAVPGILSLIGMIQIIKLSPVYILSIGFPIVMIIPAILALTGGIMTIVQFHYLSQVDTKPYPGRGFDILFLIASITYLLWLAGLLIAVVIV